MNKSRESHLFILSAPSGTGKTVLGKLLLQDWSEKIVRIVTSTTRAPRKIEKNDVDYYFLEEPEFRAKQARGEFLEYAEVFGALYGTEMRELKRASSTGKNLLLVIDTQGALQVKKIAKIRFNIYLAPK